MRALWDKHETSICTATDFELESVLFEKNNLEQSSFQIADVNLFSDETLDPIALATGKASLESLSWIIVLNI